jgi:hypothetical protein
MSSLCFFVFRASFLRNAKNCIFLFPYNKNRWCFRSSIFLPLILFIPRFLVRYVSALARLRRAFFTPAESSNTVALQQIWLILGIS